jgi:hypothetical protein
VSQPVDRAIQLDEQSDARKHDVADAHHTPAVGDRLVGEPAPDARFPQQRHRQPLGRRARVGGGRTDEPGEPRCTVPAGEAAYPGADLIERGPAGAQGPIEELARRRVRKHPQAVEHGAAGRRHVDVVEQPDVVSVDAVADDRDAREPDAMPHDDVRADAAQVHAVPARR